jgi:hypothetical protein
MTPRYQQAEEQQRGGESDTVEEAGELLLLK